jgi:hypothetical protein
MWAGWPIQKIIISDQSQSTSSKFAISTPATLVVMNNALTTPIILPDNFMLGRSVVSKYR